MKLVLNLGLNNNPCSIKVINTIFKPLGLKVSQLRGGKYNENTEPTYVAVFDWAEVRIETIESVFKLFCEVFTQECIAFKVYEGKEVHERLVFNDNYEGETFPFSNDYFLDFDVLADFDTF